MMVAGSLLMSLVMKPSKTFVGIVMTTMTTLMMLGAAGCAAGADEDTDEGSGALNGAPGPAFDRAQEDTRLAQQRADAEMALRLKKAAHAAYRVVSADRLGAADPKTLACVPRMQGARAFSWTPRALKVGEGAISDFERELSVSDYARSVIIVQRPGLFPETFDVSVYAARLTEGTVCAKNGTPIEVLKCVGVGRDEGPTEQQCGL